MRSKSTLVRVLAAVMVAGISTGRADDAALQEKVRQLERRISELESKPSADAIVPSAVVPPKTLEFLAQSNVGGGVMATWFTDFNYPGPPGTTIPLEGVSTYNHEAFSANLAELYFSNPVDASAGSWDAGYKVTLLFGEDVKGLQDGLDFGGGRGTVWEVYGAVNIPVGRGVVAKVGKFATYLGHEVVLPWKNRQITYGFQFAFVEPFTHTGLALETALSDKVSVMFSINNGWNQTFERGDGVAFLGQLKIAATDQTEIILDGYTGSEGGEASQPRRGVDVVITQRLGDKMSITTQWDLGQQELDGAATASWYAFGAWLNVELTEKFGVSFRGEYLRGDHGFFGAGFPLSVFGSGNQDVFEFTQTLTFKPGVPGLEWRLEVRWDGADEEALFGHDDRTVLALAALYAF